MGRNREEDELWNAPRRPCTEVVSLSQSTGTVGGYSSSSGGARGTATIDGLRTVFFKEFLKQGHEILRCITKRGSRR